MRNRQSTQRSRKGPAGERPLVRRIRICAAIAGLAVVGALALYSDPARADTTERVNVGTGGLQANAESPHFMISHDGRFVVFVSKASNLVAGTPADNRSRIFVHDRETGATECVSVDSAGNIGWAANNVDPVDISADGRFVAFDSPCSFLVPEDTNNRNDVFVHDRLTGATERVSVAADGAGGNDHSWDPSISGDGRFVAFKSGATNLGAGTPNGGLFLRDRQTGATSLITKTFDGQAAANGGELPVISTDGRFVAFRSWDAYLVPNDSNGTRPDIFVYDRHTDSMELVSKDSDGTQYIEDNVFPEISGDGSYVCFKSEAAFVPGDTNDQYDVYLHQRATGATTLIGFDMEGNPAGGGGKCAVSDGGRYVSFVSSANDLVPDDTNARADVFVVDRRDGTTERVSVASDGTQANWGTQPAPPGMGCDGRLVGFASASSTLVPWDTNNTTDIFVRDREEAELDTCVSWPFMPGPPPVPSGAASGTAPLIVEVVGPTGLFIEWDDQCAAGYDTQILYGSLSGLADYTLAGSVCAISNPEVWDPVPPGDLWFIVTSYDGAGTEGSWGEATAGERNGLDASGMCGCTSKDVTGTCP